ncbi:GumC family protein [Desulfospira joergensenii]|uniref:GumC family protein n=1 Tax=Desulfospira joergensenii TaxID=53329 RepID=UPI0003B59368|nr:Wzz/FepE/Etk N-terminal domain-containing protein [Desulfospira joergensenii]
MVEPLQAPAQIKPDQIIDVIVRGKWIIIIPICLSLTLGVFMTLTSHKTYEASTLILVQPQRVPTNYVQSVVTSTISQRISTISQQILSRSNLEKIIDQFGLFANSESMYLEDKIAKMRKKIKVKIERARHGAEAFSISFTGSEPQRVMRIANTLASYFMDENLKVREAQAIGTSEFLDSELEKTRKRLEDREQKLAQYRAKYLGGLPDELETNLRTLDRLQQQLIEKNTMLREARNGLNMLEKQIAQSKEIASQSFQDPIGEFEFEEDENFTEAESEKKLAVVKNQYDNLLLRYTKKHPDVAKLKKTMEKLEKSIEEEKNALKEEQISEGSNMEMETVQDEENTDNEAQNIGAMSNFAAMQQEAQLKQIKNEIQKIQSDISAIEKSMKLYQKRVEDTPKRELELQSLKRDYSNIQSVFHSLLGRKLEAELSVNMEKKQKGEQFRILDHARLPEKPISPNVQLFFMVSVVGGAGIGTGIVFLLEILNFSVIRRDEQIEKNLGLNILATIPPLEKSSDRLRRRITTMVFTGCCVYAGIFLAFFMVLNAKGLDRTLNFIKMHLNL